MVNEVELLNHFKKWYNDYKQDYELEDKDIIEVIEKYTEYDYQYDFDTSIDTYEYHYALQFMIDYYEYHFCQLNPDNALCYHMIHMYHEEPFFSNNIDEIIEGTYEEL